LPRAHARVARSCPVMRGTATSAQRPTRAENGPAPLQLRELRIRPAVAARRERRTERRLLPPGGDDIRRLSLRRPARARLLRSLGALQVSFLPKPHVLEVSIFLCRGGKSRGDALGKTSNIQTPAESVRRTWVRRKRKTYFFVYYCRTTADGPLVWKITGSKENFARQDMFVGAPIARLIAWVEPWKLRGGGQKASRMVRRKVRPRLRKTSGHSARRVVTGPRRRSHHFLNVWQEIAGRLKPIRTRSQYVEIAENKRTYMLKRFKSSHRPKRQSPESCENLPVRTASSGLWSVPVLNVCVETLAHAKPTEIPG
jgi:hypothetical protein